MWNGLIGEKNCGLTKPSIEQFGPNDLIEKRGTSGDHGTAVKMNRDD